MTARYADALPILDDYLVRHPTDQEALFAAVLAQYEITATAGVPLSNVARAKLAKSCCPVPSRAPSTCARATR